MISDTDPRDPPPGASAPGASAREETDAADPAPPGAEAAADFVLRLPTFEGPLDLLLHLIERQELDITDLSVMAVAEQYLGYLRSGEQISLSALATFVAMGARLLLLKSRALLPGDRTEDAERDEDGDAAGLVTALQEYRRYKRAADHLRRLEDDHRTAYRREAEPPQTQLPTGLDSVTLDALAGVFRNALERLPEPAEQTEIARDPVRLADRVALLTGALERDGRISFRELVTRASTRLEVIVDFLAVLELIKARFLETRQSDAFGDIELVRIEGASPPTPEELASAEDETEAGGVGEADTGEAEAASQISTGA